MAIVESVEGALMDPEIYGRMARAHSPYGDGRAAERIVEIFRDWHDDRAVVGTPADVCDAAPARRAGGTS
jgi:UDP-N-acetylglucosamine 2-epimerase